MDFDSVEKNTPAFAEFAGILLGDGCIGVYVCKNKDKIHKQFRVKITLDSRNKKYLKHVARLFEKIFGFKPLVRKRKGENTCDILSFNKNLVAFLLNSGLKKSPKWDRAKIPGLLMNSQLGKYVLKGYFDTDGAIVVYNNNGTLYPKIEMKISPAPMQGQFLQLLKAYDIRFNVRQIGKGKILVQINGLREVMKWLSVIGASNQTHVDKIKNTKFKASV